MKKLINIIVIVATSSILFAKDYHVDLVELKDNNFTIEFAVQHYSLSRKEGLISIDNLSDYREFGKPRLPQKAVLLDIKPFTKYAANILETEFDVIDGIEVPPTPTPAYNEENIESVEYSLNKDPIYNENRLYPHELVEINYLGFMRDHYLMQVRFNVVQYNPVTKKIKVYKKIKIKLEQFPAEKQLINSNDNNKLSCRKESSEVFDEIISTSILNSLQTNLDFQSQQMKMKQDTEGNFDAVSFYRQIADLEAYKISINKDGIYRLNYSHLRDAGLNVFTVNPLTLRLYNKGQEIPVYIYGKQDGIFDMSDYILFYGESNKTIYSDENIYWLVLDDKNGLRMGEKDGASKTDAEPMNAYKNLRKMEENIIYKASMPGRDDDDHWTWEEIKYNETKDFTFKLYDVKYNESEQGIIRIKIYGAFYTDHSVTILLNQQEIVTETWEGKGNHSIIKSFPQSLLKEGKNKLSFRSESADDFDILALDWFELDYWRYFSAINGSLKFVPHRCGLFNYNITNFKSNNVHVFEIENPYSVNRILKISVQNLDGKYGLLFDLNVDTTNQYICLDDEAILQPLSITRDEPSYLYHTSQQADYVIITHKLFHNSIIPLAELHRQNGLTVSIATVQNLYDEFNYGIFDPQAIKDFLSYTYYQWSPPAPTYVLLVGDASYDYKDYLGMGNQNYVPTFLFQPEYSEKETANDNWFICVSGSDVIPDMFCGRLAVRSTSDIESIIDKIINYESDYTHWDWKKNFLLVSDDSKKDENFESMSDNILIYVPSEYNVKKIYLSNTKDVINMRQEIISFINNGCLLLNYIGHGAIDFWAREKIFSLSLINSLSNRKFPFVTAFSCSSGMFQHAEKECLAEAMAKSRNKGAIAVWTAAGSPVIYPYNPLGQVFFYSLFEKKFNTIGSIITKAKIDYLNQFWSLEEVAEMFTLLGDPAMRLNMIDYDVPIVELHYHGNSLMAEQQYVHPKPVFIAEINAKHSLIKESLMVKLDNEAFDYKSPIIEYAVKNKNSCSCKIQTAFEHGSHQLSVLIADSAGFRGEDRITFNIQQEELFILNVLNYPNPFRQNTYFTYELSQPAEVIIKIYTTAGRLIKVIKNYSVTSFNSIEWDGLDADGNIIANGVYLYKLTARNENKNIGVIERLLKIK
ncbi:MAG: T9SS type A sorting domain-containing protein [Candidatus Lokiarchaeota archaeon]|nr:T9SS type A sorting domain-containing protein [Candidatus Lokiarchaeota archaeon]